MLGIKNKKPMSHSKHELVLYYNAESSIGKQTLAYAQTHLKHIIAYEFSKMSFTGTRWRQLLYLLNLQPKQLLNKADPWYQEKIRGQEYGDDEWTSVLIKNPNLIKAPIAIKGEKAILCKTPTDILRLI